MLFPEDKDKIAALIPHVFDLSELGNNAAVIHYCYPEAAEQLFRR